MEFGIIGTLFGVALGFVVVMLLLSLLVTGVSQGVQSLAQLRGRATRAVLVEELMKRDAAHAVEKANQHLPMRKSTPPKKEEPGTMAKLFDYVMGPADRIVYPEELRKMGFDTPEERERFNAAVTDRFTRWMRLVTLACSLAVACLFQVSATELVKTLSTDQELRQKALEAADRIEAEEAGLRAASRNFTAINEQAVQKLASEQPDLAGELEQVSGRAVDQADAAAELRLILANHPERDKVVARYEELLKSGVEERTAQADRLRQRANSELALLDLTFWRHGDAFFYVPANGKEASSIRWANVVGVLITGVLLSFGAPFWYERLRDLKVLRDSLYSRPERKKDAKPEPDQESTASGGGTNGGGPPKSTRPTSGSAAGEA